MEPPPPAPRRRLHWSAWTVLALIALVALLGAAVLGVSQWLWRTEAGLATVARALPQITHGVVTVEGARGNLADAFSLDLLRINAGSTTVEVRHLQAQLARARFGVSLAALRFEFDGLTAERVLVRVRPSGKPASGPPASIASPVAVSAQRLAVGELVIATGADPEPAQLEFRAVNARAAIDHNGYRVEQGRLALGPLKAPLQVSIDGTLGGAPPFAVDARGTLETSLQDKSVQARWRASRSLTDLLVDAEVAGGGAQGNAQLRVASFDAPALRELRVDLDALDPAAWLAGAPTARLAVKADLRPQPAPTFTLRGPVSVSNGLPGPIDQHRVPLRSAHADVQLTREALVAREIVGELTRGSVRGSYTLSLTDVRDWQADAQLAGVDPVAIHSRLRPLAVDGSARVRHDNDTTRVVADLANRGKLPARLQVDLALTPRLLRIGTAELTLGQGQAHVSGEVALDGDRRAQLQGTVSQLDPSLLVEGIDARLSGSFEIDATLAPQPVGRLGFAIADSVAYGRPLAGHGRVALAADQSFDADVDLHVRSASLSARGALGRPGQTLTLQVAAPELKELGLAVAGSVKASARLSGDWHAPAGEFEVAAQRLRTGEHSLEDLHASGNYAGGRDGALALKVSAANHHFRNSAALSLRSIELAIDGRPSDHRIELKASNEQAQPLIFGCSGAWLQDKRQWQGQITSLQAGAPLNLQLQQPATVTTDLSNWRVGPTTLLLAGAEVQLLQLESTDGRVQTRGRFTGLKLGELTRSDSRTLTIVRNAPQPPLELRGEWQVSAAATLDGSLLIERSAGDVYTATRAGAMGITELRIEAQARANRLHTTARLRGERAGVLNAELQAELDPAQGWQFARQRPWLIVADADLPSISWISSLLSDRLRSNVRLGGSLSGNVRIEGTPADPVAKGGVNGKDLRVSWIEQAVRLDHGTLAARVDGSEIVLDELRFTGAPRVEPGDRRAREFAGNDEGSLTVNGHLQLNNLSGVLQVQAQRMPLVQRADRWVRANGGANIVFDRKQVQLNGAIAADVGYFDISRPNLPTLSKDVEVVRGVQPVAAASREAPVGFAFDIGIDLGQHFYLRGYGLDTRVEGAVRLRSDGRGAVRATGSVEAKEGVFEGYGQKLAIERGRVNFQGPPENPGLDILAVRKDLPVTVGVSITRTAQNPLIRLYSDESMTDVQILSWLVLGRAPDEGPGSGDSAALATAAVGLLSGTSEGIPKQLAHRLGIDEVGIRTGDLAGSGSSLLPRTAVAGNVRGTGNANTVSEAIVTVGKRVNDAISISYEQAYSTNEAVVKVTYRLSRTLSVIGRAGTESALDLVYSIAFD